MKRTAFAIALVLAVTTFSAVAQSTNNPPPAGDGPGRGPGGFHILPPHAQEQLTLTADQQKQLADLETEVKAKVEKILTPAQLEKLKQMRPPHRQGRPGAGGTNVASEGQPNLPE